MTKTSPVSAVVAIELPVSDDSATNPSTNPVETLNQRKARILAEMGYTPERIAVIQEQEARIMASGAQELKQDGTPEDKPVYESKWTDIRDFTVQLIADLRYVNNERTNELAEYLTVNLKKINDRKESSATTRVIQAKLLLNLIQVNPTYWFIERKKVEATFDAEEDSAPNSVATEESRKAKYNIDKANFYNNTRAKITYNPSLPEMTAVDSIITEFNLDANKVVSPIAKAIVARYLLQQNNELLKCQSALGADESFSVNHSTADDEDVNEDVPSIGALMIQKKTVDEFRAWQAQANALKFAGAPARKEWKLSLLRFWTPLIQLWQARDLLKGNPTEVSLDTARKLLVKADQLAGDNASLRSDIHEELKNIPTNAQSGFTDLF